MSQERGGKKMDCIFCRIVAGEVPAQYIHEDPEIVAFPDINPQAPIHILVVPSEHVPSLADLRPGGEELVAHLIQVASQLARKEGIAERGYRLVINSGREGGQVVPHLHLHLLGGHLLSDEMG